MSACDSCDHICVCAYINKISNGKTWQSCYFDVYCLANETDGPPYGKFVNTGYGSHFVRLDRLFDRRMESAL
jgi:hypothetical protein